MFYICCYKTFIIMKKYFSDWISYKSYGSSGYWKFNKWKLFCVIIGCLLVFIIIFLFIIFLLNMV